MARKFLGVDPGVSGGLAVVDIAGIPVFTSKMPSTERELLDVLELLDDEPNVGVGIRAAMEKVNAGVFAAIGRKMGAVSAFTFGRNVGMLKTALVAARIPFDEVLPADWQKVMSCRTKGDKNVSKRRAEYLFPSIKVTHAIADALLLAEYCRRVERGRSAEGDQHGKEDRQEEGRGEEGRSSQGSEAGAGTQDRKPFDGWVPKGRTRRGTIKGSPVPGAPRHGRGARQASR